MRGIPGHGYESSSMLSSDLETTSFLESEDDASSRITSTTGRATNLSIDRMGTYLLSLFVLSLAVLNLMDRNLFGWQSVPLLFIIQSKIGLNLTVTLFLMILMILGSDGSIPNFKPLQSIHL